MRFDDIDLLRLACVFITVNSNNHEAPYTIFPVTTGLYCFFSD